MSDKIIIDESIVGSMRKAMTSGINAPSPVIAFEDGRVVLRSNPDLKTQTISLHPLAYENNASMVQHAVDGHFELDFIPNQIKFETTLLYMTGLELKTFLGNGE